MKIAFPENRTGKKDEVRYAFESQLWEGRGREYLEMTVREWKSGWITVLAVVVSIRSCCGV